MNLISILLLFGCLFNSDSNKFHTLYEVGRPAGLEYNNAKKEAGKKWNILWIYADNAKVEEMGYEKIGNHNDSVMAILAKKRGEDWQREFYLNVDEELNHHNKLRKDLKSHKNYKFVNEELIEPHLLFERKTNRKRSSYIVHIVGQKKEEPGKGFITLCKFFYKPNKSPSFDCKEQPLTIYFPQNGIK
ncbi:MAG: hypothetical protein M3Q58_11250 [Bacteroidota bacterium]|nr:hypothetical protein [Bacteroidota bacterium]